MSGRRFPKGTRETRRPVPLQSALVTPGVSMVMLVFRHSANRSPKHSGSLVCTRPGVGPAFGVAVGLAELAVGDVSGADAGGSNLLEQAVIDAIAATTKNPQTVERSIAAPRHMATNHFGASIAAGQPLAFAAPVY